MNYKYFINFGKENKFDLLKINKNLKLLPEKYNKTNSHNFPISEETKIIQNSYDKGVELYILALLNNNIYKCENKSDALVELLKIKSPYIEKVLKERSINQMLFEKKQAKLKNIIPILLNAIDDLFEKKYLEAFEKITKSIKTITSLPDKSNNK